MRHTLEVDEETAKKLRELAAADEVSIDDLLAAHIPGLKTAGGNGAAMSDALSALDEWLESFPQDAPPLSDDAISRSSFYRDR